MEQYSNKVKELYVSKQFHKMTSAKTSRQAYEPARDAIYQGLTLEIRVLFSEKSV